MTKFDVQFVKATRKLLYGESINHPYKKVYSKVLAKATADVALDILRDLSDYYIEVGLKSLDLDYLEKVNKVLKRIEELITFYKKGQIPSKLYK